MKAILSTASGGGAASPYATAALESAAGLIGRSFSAAEVHTGSTAIRDVLSPELLGLVGRSLIRHGEVVFYIDVDDAGVLNLLPACKVEIKGAAAEASWRYSLNVNGPSKSRKMKGVEASGVCHFRYAVDASKPWIGVGPLQVAWAAGRLSAELEAALADEVSSPVGHLLPIPSTDGQDKTVELLRSDIKKAKGATLIVEAGDWGSPGGVPGAGWEPRRLGAEPPAALVNLQASTTSQVLAACGVSPALMASGASAGGMRESWRQLRYATLSPLGKMVEAELTRKLETEITLGWDALAASDVTGRARAYASLVAASMPAAEARRLTGLE